jgi:hypothetical protein
MTDARQILESLLDLKMSFVDSLFPTFLGDGEMGGVQGQLDTILVELVVEVLD